MTGVLPFAAPGACAEALAEGLALCGGGLLASLFPYLIVSVLLVRSGAAGVLGWNLLAHLRKNPSFLVIMLAVAVIQIGLIYYGGSLFRTAGLTFGELRRVLLIAFLVVPADCARKLFMRLFGRKGTL